MKINKNIQVIVNTYFIVVAIFLFSVNTSIAAPRPYLPTEETNWPKGSVVLGDAVAKIQEKQQENNNVIWVQPDSPYYSKPNGSSLFSEPVSVPRMFGGLQDMDMASGFTTLDGMFNFIDKRKPEQQVKHSHSAVAVTPAVASNGRRAGSLSSIDEPALPEQQAEGQKAMETTNSFLSRNVWRYLDS